MRAIFAFVLIFAILPLSGWPTTSFAQSSNSDDMPCHKYQEIAAQLGKRYSEAPISIGMQTNGHMLQVFASKEHDSWTILSVSPAGIGCVVAAGRNWEQLPKQPNGPQI